MIRVRMLAAFGLFAALALAAGCGKKPDPTPEVGVGVDPAPGPAPDLEPAPEPVPDADTLARLELIRRWRWIAAAASDYGARHGAFPAGIVGPGNELGLSWRVQLLPYLGHDDLYKQFKRDEAWDSPHNKQLVAKMPKVFESPKNPAPPGKTYLRAFTGTAFIYSYPPSVPNNQRTKRAPGQDASGLVLHRISDGTVNTLMAVEAAEPSEWTRPDDFPFHPGGPKLEQPLPKLGGVFDGGFYAVNIYGDVLFPPSTTKESDLRALITPGSGDTVGPDFWNSILKRPKPWQRVSTRIPVELADTAARKSAVANYRAILTGLHSFAKNNDQWSPGGIAEPKGVGLSWRVQLLPFIGEEELYKQFKLDEPWNSAANKPLVEKMPKVFESSGKPAPKGHTFVRGMQGTHGLLPPKAKPGELVVPDPIAKAKPGEPLAGSMVFAKQDFLPGVDAARILLVEAGATPWTQPDELVRRDFDVFDHDLSTPPPLGGVFDGGFHAVMGDGRITFYKNGYPATHLMRMLLGSMSRPVDPLADEDKVLYSIPAPPGMFPLK